MLSRAKKGSCHFVLIAFEIDQSSHTQTFMQCLACYSVALAVQFSTCSPDGRMQSFYRDLQWDLSPTAASSMALLLFM